jgi:hypothetical protein
LLSHVLDDNPRPPIRTDRHKLLITVGLALVGGVTGGTIIAATTSDENQRPSLHTATSTVKSPTASQGARPISPPVGAAALIVRCRVSRCGVFISSSPDNNVLFNGVLRQGEERRANESRMNLVVSDAAGLDVFINGKLQPKGRPGARKIYMVVKK